ncbi:transposase-like protein [Salinibacter ruber]|nr:transposase-like protein [Salinibacter ruber]
MTRRSKSCFRVIEAWLPFWSRPENQILQAEMTDHLSAGPEERTDDRQGYRNGSYERQLTTRVGTLELEVPRDRKGEFQTALFQRQERSEKALVLALMQQGPPGRLHAPREGDHH